MFLGIIWVCVKRVIQLGYPIALFELQGYFVRFRVIQSMVTIEIDQSGAGFSLCQKGEGSLKV